MSDVTLQVSDWNYQDKWYKLPLETLKTFGEKVLAEGRDAAWDWFTTQTDYFTNGFSAEKDTAGLPAVRCDNCVDHTLEEYFWDWEQPTDCVQEWQEQWDEED